MAGQGLFPAVGPAFKDHDTNDTVVVATDPTAFIKREESTPNIPPTPPRLSSPPASPPLPNTGSPTSPPELPAALPIRLHEYPSLDQGRGSYTPMPQPFEGDTRRVPFYSISQGTNPMVPLTSLDSPPFPTAYQARWAANCCAGCRQLGHFRYECETPHMACKKACRLRPTHVYYRNNPCPYARAVLDVRDAAIQGDEDLEEENPEC
jgi:hypothetical protein